MLWASVHPVIGAENTMGVKPTEGGIRMGGCAGLGGFTSTTVIGALHSPGDCFENFLTKMKH
jgi:hypothetical protein